MTSVIRDDQRKPIWFGISSTDGVTLVPIQVNSVNGAVKAENGTSTMPVMSAIPKTLPRDDNFVSSIGAVSSADDITVIPLSVNPATGAIQLQST